MSAYGNAGSTSSTKDSNVMQCVITSTIVRNQINKAHLIRKTSQTLKVIRKTLMKLIGTHERFEEK